MLYLIVYMMQILPTIGDIFQVLAGFSFVLMLILGLGCIMNIDDPCTPKVMKFVKILSITC